MPIVLIVEDNPINRDVLGRRLEKRGYSVRFAEDGPAGIEAASRLHPDLILMDIGLGASMDGWEVTRCLKGDPSTADIPVIALTASAFESDRTKSLASGCVDFDTKPVDLARLLSKIEQILQHSPARSRPAPVDTGDSASTIDTVAEALPAIGS